MGMDDLRNWMNERPAAVALLAVVVVAGALFWILRPEGVGPRAQEYFYDPVEGAFFAASSYEASPTTSPDGNESYIALRYTCDRCTEDEMFTVYYRRYTPRGLEMLAEIRQFRQRPLEELSGEEEMRFTSLEQAIQQEQEISVDAENWEPYRLGNVPYLEEAARRCERPGDLRLCRPG